jgi:hypothetical protein
MFFNEFVDGLVVIIEAVLVVVFFLHSWSLLRWWFDLELRCLLFSSDRASSNLFLDEVQVKITVTLC